MMKCKAHVLDAKWRSRDVMLEEKADFSSLLLSEKVLRGLAKARFQHPSPIQLEAIPAGRCGTDLVIQAKSGTGKTLVFTVVALEMLMDIKTLQVLIMTPTREIATQICDVIKTVGSSFTKLRCASFIGGLPLEEDKAKSLRCQIAVGTPGRIKQLIDIGYLRTNAVRLFVLDEADELLRATCTGDIDWIFQTLPEDKQVIAASATYPKELEGIINKYFRQPYVIRLNIDELSLLGTVHYACLVDECKMPVLSYKLKLEALKKLLCAVKFSQCIVYCNLVSRVEGLCYDIQKWGFSVTHISSAKDQLDRLKAIERLKQFKCKVLVSSDVTARGIDAENVDIIINFDCPLNTETYLHRVGRAGRYGSQGIAVTFLSQNQLSYFEKTATAGSFKVYLLSDPVPSDLITKRPEVNNAAVFGCNDKKLSNPLKMFYSAGERGNSKPEDESTVVDYFQKRNFLDCHSDASSVSDKSNNNTYGTDVIADQDIQLLNENSDSLKFEDNISNQREKIECYDSNIKCVSVNVKMKLQKSQYQSNGTCDSELHEGNCDKVKAVPEQAIDSFKFIQSESKISELFECEASKPNDSERNVIENETVTDEYILFDERTVPASLTCDKASDLNHTQSYCENEYAKQQLTNSCSEQVLESKERRNNFNLEESVIEGPMSVLENQQSASESKYFSDKQKEVQIHSLSNTKSVDGMSQKTENLNFKSLDEIKEFVINFVCKYENQELLNAETLSVNSNFYPDEECLQRFQNELASPEQASKFVSPEDIKNRKKSMLKHYYELFKEYQDYFENLEFDSNALKEKVHQILKEDEVTDGYCEAFQIDAHESKTQQVLNSDNVRNLFCDARSEKCSSEAVNENNIVNAEAELLSSGSAEPESGGLPRIENFYKFAEALYYGPMEVTELSSEETSSESSSGATEEDDIVNDAISNMPKGEVEQCFSAGNSEHESEGLPKIEIFHKFTETVYQDHMKTHRSSEVINEDEMVNANVLTMPEDEVENLSFINNSENGSESLPKIVDFYKFAEALNQHRTDVVLSASEDEASSEATSEDEIINADIQNLPKGLVEDLFATEHGLESLPTIEDFYNFSEAVNRNNMEEIQLSPKKSSEAADENGILNDIPNMRESECDLPFIAENSEHKSENIPIIEDVHEFDGTVHQDYMELIQSRSEKFSDYVQPKVLNFEMNKKMLEYAFRKSASSASDHNVYYHENRKVPKEVMSSETDDDDVSFHKNYKKDFVQRNSSDKKPKHGIAKNYPKVQNFINHSVRPTSNDFELYKKNSESKRHMNHSMSRKSKHRCEIFKNCSKTSHHNANNSTKHDLYCEPSTYTPRRTDHPACSHGRIRNFKHLEHGHDYREFSQNNVFHSTCNCCRNSHFCKQTNSVCKNSRHANHGYDFHRSLNVRSKCLKPSQHHCHPIYTDTSCQSQICCEWYKLFINQWLCLKNTIIFHK